MVDTGTIPPRAFSMISVPGQAQGIVGHEFAISRRSFGSYRRVDRDGGCNRLRADWPVRKAGQAGELSTTRGASTGSCGASPARAGDSGSAKLDGTTPCGMAWASLFSIQRRR